MENLKSTLHKKPLKGGLIKLAYRVFLVGIFIFVGFFLIHNFPTIRSRLYEANLGLLGLSFSFHFLFVLFQGILGVSVLRSTGAKIQYNKALPILCLSLLGRYVPGKIWVVTSRVLFFAKRGIKTAQVVAASVMEHVFTILSGLLIAAIFFSSGINSLGQTPFMIIFILIGLLLLPPRFINTLINRILSFFGKQTIEGWTSRGTSLCFICLYSLNWFVLGFGLVLLAKSFYPGIHTIMVFPWTGLYSLAVSAGFLAFFSPGGLGVRESIFFIGFSAHLPAVEATTLALMTRLIVTLAEITVLFFSLIYGMLSREISGSVDISENTVGENWEGFGND